MDRRLFAGLLGIASACSDYEVAAIDRSNTSSDSRHVSSEGVDSSVPYVEADVVPMPSNPDVSDYEASPEDPACFSNDPACMTIENTLPADGRYHADMAQNPVEFDGRLPLRLGDFINGSRSDAYVSCVSSETGLTACVSEDFSGSPYLVFSEGAEDDSFVHFGVPFNGSTDILDLAYLGKDVFALGYVRGEFPEGTEIPYDSLLVVNAGKIVDEPSIVDGDLVNSVLFKRMGQWIYDSGDTVDSHLMNQIDSTRSMPDDGIDYTISGVEIPLGDNGQGFASVALVPGYVSSDFVTIGTTGSFNVGGLEIPDLPETGHNAYLFDL